MANNIKGITIEIGGDTSPLDKALKGVNKTSKELQIELGAVNKQLKFDPTNTTLLTQKQQLLTESIMTTRGKLQTLKEAEKQVEEQFQNGKIGEEKYRAFQREVIATEQKLNTLEKQVTSTNAAFAKITATTDKVSEASSKVASKTAPATIAIAAAGVAAVKMGSDYSESLNKVDVAFKGNAKEVEEWSNTTLDKFGIAGGTALDMASLFGDMGTAMGQTTDKAAEMSMSVVGLSGDLASFKNIGIDQAKDALKGIYTGEGEGLKTLGIIMTDTTLKEYAHAKGIKTKYEEMSQSEKVNLRYNYVMEMTKNAQGDFARTSDGTANSTRVLGESVKELATNFGQMLLPIITPIIQKITEVIKHFSGMSDTTKKIILVILGLVAAIAPVATMISGITTIVGAVTAVIGTISGAIGLLTGALTVATPAATALAGAITFITGPIGLTILAVTALVAGFAYLWTNCEAFRKFWINLWESVKSGVSYAVDVIKDFFVNTLPEVFNKFKSFLSEWGTVILAVLVPFIGIPILIAQNWSQIKTFFINLFNYIASIVGSWVDNIKNFFNNLINGVVSILNSLKASFLNIFTNIKTSVASIVQGFIDLLINRFGTTFNILHMALENIKDVFRYTWEAIKTIVLAPVLLLCDLLTGNFTKLKEDLNKILLSLEVYFSIAWVSLVTAVKQIVMAFKLEMELTWMDIKNFIISAITAMKNLAINIWQDFKNGVEIIINSTKQVAVTIWIDIKNSIINTINALKNAAINSFNFMKDGIYNNVINTKDWIISTWDSIMNLFMQLPGRLYNIAVSMFSSMKSGVSNTVQGVKSAIVSGIEDAVRYITNLPRKAYEWGTDFVDGLIRGIKGAIGKVEDTVSALAAKIRSYLHFSVPDEGPLTDYETWMPDFMMGLSKGIEKSKNLVVNSIKGLSSDMSFGMNLTPATVASGIGQSNNQQLRNGDIINNNFNGNYSFNNKNDIDYFMNQAAKLVQRKK